MKVDLNDIDPEHKRWLPVFIDIFGKMGTKQFKYNEFNDKLMASTTGLSISADSYSKSDDLNQSESQMLLSIGFLDRNIDEAFECLKQILTTPNFDEPTYIQNLFRQMNVQKTQAIGNNGV